MAKPGLIDRMKERKRLVEEGDLEGAREKAQEHEGGYPSDREAMRPVRKTEGGKYDGVNVPDSIGTDVDAPPRPRYTKKRTY